MKKKNHPWGYLFIIPILCAGFVLVGYIILFALAEAENPVQSIHQILLSAVFMLAGSTSLILTRYYKKNNLRILFYLYALYLIPPSTHLLFSSAVFFSLKTAGWFYIYYSNIFMYFTLDLLLIYAIFYIKGKIKGWPDEYYIKIYPALITTIGMVMAVYYDFIFGSVSFSDEAEKLTALYQPLYKANFIFILLLMLAFFYYVAQFRHKYRSFFRKLQVIKMSSPNNVIMMVHFFTIIFLAFVLTLEWINALNGWVPFDLSAYFLAIIVINYAILIAFFIFLQWKYLRGTATRKAKVAVSRIDQGWLKPKLSDRPTIIFLKLWLNDRTRFLVLFPMFLLVLVLLYLAPQEARPIVTFCLILLLLVAVGLLFYFESFLLNYIRRRAASADRDELT